MMKVEARKYIKTNGDNQWQRIHLWDNSDEAVMNCYVWNVTNAESMKTGRGFRLIKGKKVIMTNENEEEKQ